MRAADPVELASDRILDAHGGGGPASVAPLLEGIASLPADRARQGSIRLIADDLEGVLRFSGGTVPANRFIRLAEVLPGDTDCEAVLHEALREVMLHHVPAAGSFLPRWAIGGDGRRSDVQLLRELGQGGFATVWEALDLEGGGALVAIKGPWRADVPGNQNERAVKLLLREAEILASLDHPNVLTLHQTRFDLGGVPYLVLERLETPDLRALTASLPADQVVGMLCDLASALEHLRHTQVVHRDVTLGNVGLGEDGRVRLFDFGMAVLMGERHLHERERAGTTDAMTLEQQIGIATEIDSRIDIAGMGLIGIQLLAPDGYSLGRSAEENIASWAAGGPTQAIDVLDAPEELLDILRRCVAQRAAARYPTPGAAMRALEKIRL